MALAMFTKLLLGNRLENLFILTHISSEDIVFNSFFFLLLFLSHVYVTSGVDGDYFRLLLPGTYTVTASSPGYLPFTSTVTVGPAEATQVRLHCD